MIDIKEIKKLSIEERILMVEEIWDSIAEDTAAEELQIPGRGKKGNPQTLRRI